ncbi:hypothetical protein HHK36_007058 [Tetracentron sinense]|uniref:Uncharacterized protein n=1 Tax=Tetracentron sinense TaxID=13715 RepID=A0A834ZLZ5_TETSI|nr:hypothetical protein HHK36_007058 [Tetracentron sinense]
MVAEDEKKRKRKMPEKEEKTKKKGFKVLEGLKFVVLRVVEMYPLFVRSEMEFIKFILAHSPTLPKMIIKAEPNNEGPLTRKRRLLRYFLHSRAASSSILGQLLRYFLHSRAASSSILGRRLPPFSGGVFLHSPVTSPFNRFSFACVFPETKKRKERMADQSHNISYKARKIKGQTQYGHITHMGSATMVQFAWQCYRMMYDDGDMFFFQAKTDQTDHMMDKAGNASQSAKESCQEVGQQMKAKAQEVADAVKDATGMNKSC